MGLRCISAVLLGGAFWVGMHSTPPDWEDPRPVPWNRTFGSVQPLDHGCDFFCRDLCFEVSDPLGVLVRLTHEVWWAKAIQHGLRETPAVVEAVVARPWQVHRDTTDRRIRLYYSEPSGPNDRLFCVAVKCIPRRFQGRWAQGRYALVGALSTTGWGEAWVCSAYWIERPKSKGVREWP